ncbi:MAG: hydrolase [Zetaproteobacteria bacterium]|nr:MAG: hydrolase [Zetaproteobacteria bacterium]
MANFSVHIGVAGALSLAAAGACIQQGLVDHGEATVLIALGTVAGVLPDVDSDHSISVRMVFGFLGFALAAAIVFLFLDQQPLGWLLGWAALAAVFMRHVVYPAFAHLTIHRGLFHSIPAALLAGLATAALTLGALHWPPMLSWLAAGFVSGGYLLHLVLDELYSVNLAGHRLKSSFGSAMTLFSLREWRGYLALYLALLLVWFWIPHPPIAFGLLASLG